MIETMLWPALLSFAGFLLLWPLSVAWKDTSVVDFWWGPGFAAMALAAWVGVGAPLDGISAWVAGLVTLWGLRLGVVLGARRLREGHEDGRYAEMRAARDPGFWWKSLFIVFILQGVLQIVIGSGLVVIIHALDPALGLLGAIGVGIALIGFAVEAVSDWQLDRYRRAIPHGGLLTTGLRAIVRYPSYLGEILFWIGLGVIGLDAGVWWSALCSILLIALVVRVSGVAILDDRLSRTRAGYCEYRARVPALIPRPSRRRFGDRAA